MSTALTVFPCTSGLAIPAVDAERARNYANAEKAAATRRAYGADFLIFRAWCEERQLDAIPASPVTVAAFLAHEASRNVKASTIGRRVAAIRYAHKLAGLDTPTDDERVKATVRGIRRTLGTAKSKKAPGSKPRGRPRLCVVYPDAKTRLNAQKSFTLTPKVNRFDTTFERWAVSTAAQFKLEDWTQAIPLAVAIATGRFTSKLPNWARV